MHRTALVILLVLARTAAASPAFHADAEVDPTAYALSGYSLHVGIGIDRARLDLGNFALAVPEFVHGNTAFDIAFDGYGAKLQLFPFAEQRGLVVGIDAAYTHVLVARRDTTMAVRDGQLQAGVNIGYRLPLVDRLYATAWLGVGHAFGARTVTLDGASYEPARLVVFPAIHVGYAFR
jgi:hypothetical protein